MTAADFAIIRDRLDNPKVVAWNPCAVALADDDPDWPVPASTPAFFETIDDFTRPTRLRLAVDGLGLVLDRFERPAQSFFDPDSPEATAPRRILTEVANRLAGAPGLSDRLLDEAGGDAFRGGDYIEYDHPIAEVIAWASGYLALDAREHTPNSTSAIIEAASLWSSGDPATSAWARCRAVLPIADVATAEIEWGEIELPPRPLDDDLPGDGGAPSVMVQ